MCDIDTLISYTVDERSILFEKQRLRLRRAVQGVVTGTASSAKTKPEPAVAPKLDPHAVSRSSVSSYEVGDYQTPHAKARPQPLQQPRSAARDMRSPRGTLKSAVRSPPGSRRTPKMAPRSPGSVASSNSQPIYAWELSNQADETNTVRERISTDSASFIPSNAAGIYVCDSDTRADSNDLMDFQVVLSAEEFQVYVSRRRNAVAEKKHSERFLDHKKTTAEKKTLLSSTPYVDPKRIQNELLRPAQPHKWVGDGGGFRPTGSKIQ